MNDQEQIRAYAIQLAMEHAECPNCALQIASSIEKFIENGEVIDVAPCDVDEEVDPDIEFLLRLDEDSLPQA